MVYLLCHLRNNCSIEVISSKMYIYIHICIYILYIYKYIIFININIKFIILLEIYWKFLSARNTILLIKFSFFT